jgi:glutaredoxin/glutathione-dependent peroxiredoxin
MPLESGRGAAYPAVRTVTGRSRKDKKMSIKVGEKIPSVSLKYMDKDGMQTVKSDELFKGKKVVLFALPGAFTPTCSAKHLPGFVQHADAIKGKGIDQIACLSVNDAFVMDAWGKAQNVGDKVLMLADGNAEFSKAVGLTMDGTNYGMGTRACRYAMVVDDGTIKALNVEAPGAFEVSSAESIMKAL